MARICIHRVGPLGGTTLVAVPGETPDATVLPASVVISNVETPGPRAVPRVMSRASRDRGAVKSSCSHCPTAESRPRLTQLVFGFPSNAAAGALPGEVCPNCVASEADPEVLTDTWSGWLIEQPLALHQRLAVDRIVGHGVLCQARIVGGADAGAVVVDAPEIDLTVGGAVRHHHRDLGQAGVLRIGLQDDRTQRRLTGDGRVVLQLGKGFGSTEDAWHLSERNGCRPGPVEADRGVDLVDRDRGQFRPQPTVGHDVVVDAGRLPPPARSRRPGVIPGDPAIALRANTGRVDLEVEGSRSARTTT